jgi:phenylalanyl-tRNA synthetase beta chain
VARVAVIELAKKDFDNLLGEEKTREELEQEASMLGILWEDQEDRVEIEVEPNRPDLLSVEGVARALRGFFNIDPGFEQYDVQDGSGVVEADQSVEDVRPYIAAAVVEDVTLNERSLNSLIQLQEKLAETYGRNRAKVAIGLHDMEDVDFPFTYTAVTPKDVSFTPLEMERELNLNQVLAEHEKGKKYGDILQDHDTYPIILDDNNQVLSFPPIINGVVTEVTIDTTDLFIDVTGTSKHEVVKALNIIATAVAERTGQIKTVAVNGEPLPDLTGNETMLNVPYLHEITGLDLETEEVGALLEQMNYGIANMGDGTLTVTVPAYRTDVMHQYDLIEDVVIAYGYNNVDPELPEIATTGTENRFTRFTNTVRETMTGVGGVETCSPVLSNPDKLYTWMDLDLEERDPVKMENPLTEDYTVMRTWMLPSLLAAEYA